MDKKLNIMDRITDYITFKMTPVLMKIFNRPTLNIIKNSMVNIMPFILFGSVTLLVSLLGTTSMGTEKPILPFLANYTDQIGLMNSLTMGFMTLYFSVSIGLNYAKEYKLNEINAALVSLMSFLMINIDKVTDGTIDVSSFGANALFPTMVTSILALKIFKIFINKNIVIRMPEGVPPAVGQAFSSLIPFVTIGLLYWFLRTMLQFNITEIMRDVMSPIFSGTDNIFVFTFYGFFTKLLWAFGIHADSLFQGIFDPLKLTWIAENSAAKIAGDPLPHIWTTALERTCLWTGPVLGLLTVLMFSRVKHLKTFSFAALPAAFFSIAEPVVFGLPIVMNPMLLIPFILSGTLGAFLTYGACQIAILARPFLELPWATPPVLIGFIASGDWKYILAAIFNIVLGALIYYPFVKAFEREELKRINTSEDVPATE
ncbi:PTS sugar transporter subunit IIC [Listeria ivanovii]|uniref:Permease IIC component n=2 Tax=Listeria ivanovii TaxID=1638 RepID=A0ABS1G3W6_LISIV|nr:PTS transporter subunit EIIC [Listeria ivanovii]AIS59225.1 hypothetical protein JL58_04170 [Listeria ivanovii subsp. londoniensis]AIS62060.1 hypothetical protein JL53_04655 [Listeria ivanovii subsp. londoniensis]MBC2254887.1 PTS sugar transporter subunit IIC [Listeria ivanovii]MBK1961561.1 PTS sugar transporter subunit IIC [Listeria ivanovii subsp. londoniensis]MBK1965571.1 PTS sugar transporter subunit IIC [Listeria ivanovii subsp. londoniensis]